MSQEKAQLIAPIGIMTVSGMTATGVITATSFTGNVVGSAKSLVNGTDVTAGVVTATSFAGNLTGNIQRLADSAPDISAGVTTATSFVGNLTGSVTDLTSQPAITVGLVTATSLSGPITGNVTGNITGNVTGLAVSITPGSNLGVGVCTAIQYHGDGSALTGAGSSAYIAQEVTASPNASSETIIDLSYGNVIYFDQTTKSTTVGFASTSAAEQITLIRDTGSVTPSFTTGAVVMDGNDDGSGDYLSLASSADFNMGTGDYTIECWFYPDGQTAEAVWTLADYTNGEELFYKNDGSIGVYQGSGYLILSSTNTIEPGRWYHSAVVRDSGTLKLYINGTLIGSASQSGNLPTNGNGPFYIGAEVSDSGGFGNYWPGKISNFRVVKGTAVYTSSFDPPFYELTNVTNTKLLCCQSDSSTTTAAVTPGTITANGDPTAGAQTITSASSVTPSITWPSTVKWNNDTTPTLFTNPRDLAAQVFRFTTVDTGLNYNAWEEIKNDSQNLALFIWGDNTNGGLGQNQPTSSDCSSPTQISGNWKTLVHKSDAGATQSCGAIKTDNTLWLWGRNGRYQLGLSNTTAVSSPTQLPGSWSSVKLADAAQGVKTDGTMWSWGYGNSTGAMAQNEGNVQRSSPKQVGTDTDWSHVGKSGYRYFLGIKTDDTLWICGNGSAGRLGLNNLTQRSSPTQLPGSWSQAFACSDYLGGLKTDGTLWSWGYNSYGNLGQNTSGGPTKVSSPVQIPGTWSDTTGGYNSMGGVKTDGTLWTWGFNAKGNLGHNNLTNYSSPKQLPGTTWRSVDMGYQWTVATKTDGTMWAFGSNAYGRLGINIAGYPSAGDRSSPTQIPGTTWGEQVSLGERVSVATKLS